MTGQNKTLSAKVEQTVTSTPAEHILNLLKSGLATTPFCGGIASLMSDYIPSAKQRRLKELTIKLAKEYFLNLVNTLSVLHIRILRFMAEPISYLEINKIPPEDIRGGFSQFFPVAIPGIELEVIKSAFGDLYQYDLINTSKSIFSTMASGQGLDLLGDRISNLGRRFINFCTKPKLSRCAQHIDIAYG